VQSPAGRLLALLSLLQARPRWTAEELAGRLDVTERTVRRDVARLRDLGYPVDAEVGPTGGYQLGSGGALPPLLLADDEAVAVAVGLRVAAAAGLEGCEDAAVAALAKLEQVLPVRLREQVAALHGSTVLLGRSQEGRTDPEKLLLLAQACRRQEVLHFAYCDSAGNETERRVEPFRLVHAERRWYLVAHDRDRAAWRTFRVDRVGEAWSAGHRFVRHEEPDAAALVAHGVAIGAYDHVAVVVLEASLAEAADEVARTVGVLEAIDEHRTLLRIAANDLDWIARFLAGLPFPVAIVEPPALRRALRVVARRVRATADAPVATVSDLPPPAAGAR
jgi:predicted DNA-binding transcriptional regulator YafY